MHTDLFNKIPAIFDAGCDLATAQQDLRPEAEIKLLLNRLECLLHEYRLLLEKEGVIDSTELQFVHDYRAWAGLARHLREHFERMDMLRMFMATTPPPRHLYN